jgi:CheY-like chemotaxis protein
MADVMTTVQAVCGHAALSKGIALGFKLESPEPPYLEGDAGRIEQVITNLVTNAIKFTPSGGTVDLHILAKSVAARWDIVVTVTDSGIGVPEDKKEAIFAPFMQLSSGLARAEGGVGLGLYIARSVSNAMKGKLSVYNNPSGGSIFDWQFSAPRSVGDNRGALNLCEAIDLHKTNVPSMRCLVFEDMEVNRLVVANLLSRAGHEVIFHTDGYHVVDRILAAHADIVFLDLHMPGKSGWDVLDDIAGTIATLPPIIVLTADTRRDSIRDAMANGVAGYLAKPIDAQELLDTLKAYHDRGRQHG